MPVLPSLLLVPAAPTARSDIVHSSITASPGSEAMVDLPHTPPVSLLPFSPSLLRSVFFLLLLRVPGLKRERRAECSVCVWLLGVRTCLLRELRSAGCLARARAHTNTDFRQAAVGWRGEEG